MRIAALFLLASISPTTVAHAEVISTQTVRFTLNAPGVLSFHCRPGITPNGHNFPTYSGFDLFNLSTIVPDTNVTMIGTYDEKWGTGDHCVELAREVAASLPAVLELKQTVSESTQWYDGHCMKMRDEKLEGTLGRYTLVGSAYFILGEVPEGCASSEVLQ